MVDPALAWDDEQFVPIEILQAMSKHWPVDFIEDVPPYFDDQVGANPDDVAVEGSVVELAQGQTV